jgi:hypothetical protein
MLAAVLGTTLAMAAERTAPPTDISFHSKAGTLRRGVRCATQRLSTHRAAEASATLGAASLLPGGGISIPVYFHVVYSSKGGTEQGNVSDASVQTQLDVLNGALAGTGFVFNLLGIDRTVNNKWFSGCYSLGTEAAMKQALAVDPAHVLNIYTCKPQQGILGYAYLPWDLPEDSYLHGVVALYGTLPGGYAAPYDEGDTVVHEVGHYLGLDHTFENGCAAPGDEVADTPAEATPAYECSEGRDTCPAPGLDPIYNFMDYTPDSCMYEFTAGQDTRMDGMTALYKPNLRCGNGACEAGEVCVCLQDCGTPPASESACANGIDDDCDGAVDGTDTNCGSGCLSIGAACVVSNDCCSGSCKGRPGAHTCK